MSTDLDNKNEIDKDIFEEVKNAQLVLVGIGAEFKGKDFDFSAWKIDDKQYRFIAEIYNEVPLFWEEYFYMEYTKQWFQSKNIKVYSNLSKLLEGKNYFIVTQNAGEPFSEVGINVERTVLPCGSYNQIVCNDSLLSVEACAVFLERCCKAIEEKNIDEVCRITNIIEQEGYYFNHVKSKKYMEEEYIEQWKVYTKWLQGSLNKQLCILELGVGMEYPTVIRWPFEKILYYNQKAIMFRVHELLFQFDENIKERGIKVPQNSMELVEKLFV